MSRPQSMLWCIGLACGCDPAPARLTFSSAQEAHVAAGVLSAFGLPASRDARYGERLTVPVELEDEAREVLRLTGLPRPGSGAPRSLVQGPAEIAVREQLRTRQGLESALRSLPGVVNATVLNGPAGTSVMIHHLQSSSPSPAAVGLAQGAFGREVVLVWQPVIAPPPSARAHERRLDLEVPLAGLSLLLAIALGVLSISRGRLRRVPGAP